jgi:hypothetical protein
LNPLAQGVAASLVLVDTQELSSEPRLGLFLSFFSALVGVFGLEFADLLPGCHFSGWLTISS